MLKHFFKFFIITIAFYIILVTTNIIIDKFIFNKITGTPIVFIEAGFEVKDDWSYKVGGIIYDIKEKHKNSGIEVYYFNQTYEKVNPDNFNEYDFSDIEPYGDVNFDLISKFEKENKKKIQYLVGSKNLKKYASGKKFIELK